MMILEFLISCAFLWFACMMAGFAFSVLVWFVIRLPIALFLMALGAVFCCTLILIPIGVSLIGTGFRVLL